MSKRKPPNLREKLAATLLMMVRPDKGGRMVPVIPFEEAKRMTTKQILSRFHFDHAVYVTWDGGNHPTNLTPRLCRDHIEKTAKSDAKEIAKVRRGLKKRADQRPLDRNGYPTGEDIPLGPGENPIADARHKRKVAQLIRSARRGNPMPFGRNSPLKKKLSGEIVRRD